MKTLLIALLGLQSTGAFASSGGFTILRCEEHYVSSNVVTYHVRNKYLKRIGKDDKTEEAPVLFFNHLSEDNRYMVYVTDHKNGHQVALPVQDWEHSQFKSNQEFDAGERTVSGHIPQKGHTKLQCQVFPRGHTEF